ncbi:MAG: cryptochrome/photolyase family protein [Bdellovibrionia bacterium]
MQSWGIHWFRRDLRVAGNPGLQWSWKRHEGRVVGLFCFDSQFLAREDFSHHRFAFFIQTLEALKEELRSLGSDLWVVDCLPDPAFAQIHASLKKNQRAFSSVSFNRDYEPFARERDQRVIQVLEKDLSVSVHTERDHLLIEPGEIEKPQTGDQSFYQVYSPFARRWFEKLATDEVQGRLEFQKRGLQYLTARQRAQAPEKWFHLQWKTVWKDLTPPWEDSLERFKEENQKKVTIPIPAAGSQVAFHHLQSFRSRLSEYGEKRDFPGILGTSQVSVFLKNGSLTVSQIIAELGLSAAKLKSSSGETKYLKELAWREFYYSILYFKPEVEKKSFLKRYENLQWENNLDFFEKWKEGKTGYPIVDAGMRQLKKEGWMHNRVRMIVASFLTKDLLIDWRWGEQYFMKELLDGDLAPNNGGWQWAASTGCDPQPYFRIFNPELQSLKFDPEGQYIQRYVPELGGLTSEQIHAPHRLGEAFLKRIHYPAPIVDHASRKLKALALYQPETGSKMSS